MKRYNDEMSFAEYWGNPEAAREEKRESLKNSVETWEVRASKAAINSEYPWSLEEIAIGLDEAKKELEDFEKKQLNLHHK